MRISTSKDVTEHLRKCAKQLGKQTGRAKYEAKESPDIDIKNKPPYNIGNNEQESALMIRAHQK